MCPEHPCLLACSMLVSSAPQAAHHQSDSSSSWIHGWSTPTKMKSLDREETAVWAHPRQRKSVLFHITFLKTSNWSASFDSAPLTHLLSVPPTQADKLLSVSSGKQSSSSPIAFLEWSMLTYGMDSFNCNMSKGIRCICQQLFCSCSVLLELFHIEGLVRRICFASLRLQEAISHTDFWRTPRPRPCTLPWTAGRTCICVQVHCKEPVQAILQRRWRSLLLLFDRDFLLHIRPGLFRRIPPQLTANIFVHLPAALRLISDVS